MLGLCFALTPLFLFAQTTTGLNYQAVLRKSNYEAISNQSGTALVSIIHNNTELYREIHIINTDRLGLFNLVIGKGNSVRGNFATLDWGSEGRMVKVTVSVGGDTYDFAPTELQAVPYAKVAERSLQPGPAGPKGDKGDAGATGAQGPKGDKGDTGLPGDNRWRILDDYLQTSDPNRKVRLGSSNIWSTAVLEVASQGGGSIVSSIYAGADNTAGRAIYALNLSGTGILGHSNKSFGVEGTSRESVGVVGSTESATSSGGLFVNNQKGNALQTIGSVQMGTSIGALGTLFTYSGNDFLIRNREPGRLILTSGNALSVLNTSCITIGPSRDNIGINTITPSATFHVTQGCCSTTSFRLTGSSTGETVNDGASITLTNTGRPEVLTITNHENGPIRITPGGVGGPSGPGVELNNLGFYPVSDNATDLGLSFARWRVIYATNGVIQTSDLRLKKNVENLNYGLSTVLKMRPVSYQWKADSPSNVSNLGFIAQEMVQLVPEVVINEEDTYGIKYADLIPVLTKAIQEQQTEIEALKKENEELRSKTTQVLSQQELLGQKIAKLEALALSGKVN
ncbi:MAG: hypothetical protein KIPDCIKN_03549 [Haliscomenobacter sp.]|nr:hypothetical protein [Haliscomenobacter sp.]